MTDTPASTISHRFNEPPIALDKAKELVSAIESKEYGQAHQILLEITEVQQSNLFRELGKLTRSLHEAITNFQIDSKMSSMAAHQMPDARDRLRYVIDTTEEAANKTMDSIDGSLPLVADIADRASQLKENWSKIYSRELKAGEFRELCSQIDAFLGETQSKSQEIQNAMTEVLMAQGFQDLTGQVIRRVIELVQDVEDSLVELIKMFGAMTEFDAVKETKPAQTKGVEGPIIDETREDVVTSQDEVDDLLSSLGF